MSVPVSRIVRREAPPGDAPLGDGLHPVLARIYAARAVSRAAELDYALAGLHGAESLLGIDAAVDLLRDALAGERRILVIADFDADGATGAAVAVRGLRALGATRVEYLAPNRFEYGYGLTPEIVAVAATREPDLLITVDNGISSIEGVAAARACGIPVIVTDHHLPAERLPEAAAIVNPNQPGDAFPSKCLAGVGVMFYVLVALRARLREEGWFAARGLEVPNLARLLDLVALGTVADVVPLDHNNRILVSQGLARIRAGRAHVGVRALLEIGGRDASRLTASDLAFAVAPRLNAAGRLTDMTLGIECLLCDSAERSREMAATLDRLNRERREIEADMRDQALVQVEQLNLGGAEGMPYGVCLFDPDWHQGVVGILAARIKEQLHRPVIAFAPDNGELIKGSARSVAGLHVRDALDAVAARHPGLISRFGGHAMAAGLTLERDRLDAFRDAFDQEVRRHLSERDLLGSVLTDGALAPGDIGLELARALREAGPWGSGFPEPLFDGDFEVLDRRVVGTHHVKLKVKPHGADARIDAIAFNAAADWPRERRLRLAYRLDVNRYRGTDSAQLVVELAERLPE